MTYSPQLLAAQKMNASGSPTSEAPAQGHVAGPPQRMIQQRQQQQQQQQMFQQPPQQQSSPPGNNGMYAVTAQQYQLLQQSQYALAAVRNIQEQLAQQQMQMQQHPQQQPQQVPPGNRAGPVEGGQQFSPQPPHLNVNTMSSGVPQPQSQPPQRPYMNRSASGNGRGF